MKKNTYLAIRLYQNPWHIQLTSWTVNWPNIVFKKIGRTILSGRIMWKNRVKNTVKTKLDGLLGQTLGKKMMEKVGQQIKWEMVLPIRVETEWKNGWQSYVDKLFEQIWWIWLENWVANFM